MAGQKKRLLTGLQPSGALHIGNYFGALKPFADTYENCESFLMVVDYHALTTIRDPKTLHRNTLEIVKDYLAAGVDPEKAIIFKQSDVSAHTELAWIFNCIISMSFLELGHAYKDTAGKGKEATVGLFTYPTLMAADILLYDTDIVPVGEDQRQHIEYTREIAAKFNIAFGDTFNEKVKEFIPALVATVPGTDSRKMSKSYGNIIPLFGSKDEIAKAVMGIVTDSGGTGAPNVYAIHLLVQSVLTNDFEDGRKGIRELNNLYEENKNNYKALKEKLVEDLEDMINPMRERRANFSDEDVKKILQKGAEKARGIADAKMKVVREKVGVSL